MTDRTLPLWLKIVLVVSALAQLAFGVTLLANPEALTRMWPWAMTPLTTRLLGASTLVSVPLALLSVWFDRFSAARLPLVMNLTYRVLQLAAGLVHFERFDTGSPTTWNYFGGGTVMLVAFAIALARGASLGKPVSEAQPFLRGEAGLNLGAAGRLAFHIIGTAFLILAVTFFARGAGAEGLWLEAPGNLTPLTARLFASPMAGLGLAAWLITRATKWREVAVPAVGMCTFGLAGLITVLLESAAVQPPGPVGYLVAATPAILLAMGVYLLMRPASAAAAEH